MYIRAINKSSPHGVIDLFLTIIKFKTKPVNSEFVNYGTI